MLKVGDKVRFKKEVIEAVLKAKENEKDMICGLLGGYVELHEESYDEVLEDKIYTIEYIDEDMDCMMEEKKEYYWSTYWFELCEDEIIGEDF